MKSLGIFGEGIYLNSNVYEFVIVDHIVNFFSRFEAHRSEKCQKYPKAVISILGIEFCHKNLVQDN